MIMGKSNSFDANNKGIDQLVPHGSLIRAPVIRPLGILIDNLVVLNIFDILSYLCSLKT